MTSGKLTRQMQWLIAAHPQWWLGLMLLTLHATLAWGVTSWWSHAFLLTHFGLFLLWQPLWRGERQLTTGNAILVTFGGIALLLLTSWWLLTLWIAVLLGLIGGNLPGSNARRQRFIYLLAVTYLLSMLLLWTVPNLLIKDPIMPGVVMAVRYGLLVLPLLILLIPVEMRQPEITYSVDFFSSLLLFFLVVILVLGSFAEMTLAADTYPAALAKTLLVIAGVLLSLSWLWSPVGGFAGLGQLLSRYLLSVGLPFERWLQNLAALAEREGDPALFLKSAMAGLSQLPWVSGGNWQTRDGGGEFGRESRYSMEYAFHGFRLVLHSRWRLSPALMLHVKLLTQLVGYFYEAKIRERTLKQNAYTQAIYETGARLTHDVKNLLQSMKTLCAAAESSDASQAGALQALMQRQLPQMTQRLQSTLEKLQSPTEKVESTSVPVILWWKELQQRYSGGDTVAFTASDLDGRRAVPKDLFDSVAENFIQNALQKRRQQPGLNISVHLACGETAQLTVCDDGTAIPQEKAARLLSAPVRSDWGLGIGLYQAARQAEQLGYRLTISENREGRVCFALEGRCV